MKNDTKQTIERLMLAFLALKALLHKSGIVFPETDTTNNIQQAYEKPKTVQNETNISHNPVKSETSSETRIKPPTPLDDKSPLVSQKALSSKRVFLSAEERLSVFSSLFRGRAMYAKRWESAKSGKKGYSPACKNEGVYGVCDTRRTTCADCKQRDKKHLQIKVQRTSVGHSTIGVIIM